MQARKKNALEAHLGQRIRAKRMELDLKIADVAERVKLSTGMLSKIENGQTSASLTSLEKLCGALGLKFTTLFSDYDQSDGTAQLVKEGEGHKVIRRGTRRGHTYELLAYKQGPSSHFEPFLVTLSDASEVFPRVQHEGTEFIHILEGRIQYHYDGALYDLDLGDSLTFSGDAPHGPEELRQVPIRMLSIIFYG